MKVLNFMNDFYKNFFKQNKIILKIFYYIITTLYAAAILILIFNEVLYPDFDTSQFWINELVLTANQMINAGIVPIVLFEMFLHKEKSTS